MFNDFNADIHTIIAQDRISESGVLGTSGPSFIDLLEKLQDNPRFHEKNMEKQWFPLDFALNQSNEHWLFNT